jgi:hypothetical protein
MSYSSIANKTNINKIIDEEIKEEDKNQKIIDEYENQQALMNKNNNYKNKNKHKYSEETYTNSNSNNNNKSISHYNPDFCIQPRFTNIYNKKYCIKWLTIYIDTNYYHYDYCVKLFEMLMKWVKYNNFVLKTKEHPLLGKFISLMYLLSNKKHYGYKLLL